MPRANAPQYVVYLVASTIEKKSYRFRAPAEAFCAQWNTLAGKTECAVADVETYNTKIVHMVERVNFMSGKKFMEPSNTPIHCSPSSEAYWSM